ncbi:MAG: 2-oxo acid dehydrogenase subunit E2 [Flavobacteriaceae bacterium]|jgi:2-oxoglutarate dehydrogenase E2 component (dihydrolipoamide succinyltransferase)|nr:2-oxo acid dehydrogenase subunit E2 [Flavobacteriaceae bacterium]
MAEYKLILSPMGEGVMEATITRWAKNEGDFIDEDETVIEIATDKVDSNVPSPVSGKLVKKLKEVNDTCKIGELIAILEIEEPEKNITKTIPVSSQKESEPEKNIVEQEIIAELEQPLQTASYNRGEINRTKNTFYSPLVRSICKEENISQEELESIQGSGLGGRITREDILAYVKNKNTDTASSQQAETEQSPISSPPVEPLAALSDSEEIIEMDRMRRLIAEHMIVSKQISPHVTSFVEADVTNIVLWRNKHKDLFLKEKGEKLTFMPMFIQSIVKALKDFPMVNISVNGNLIIKKKNINIGMATALPNGNLIVPVIKNADLLSLSGLAKTINDLANRARNYKLKPEDTQGGTYTITNIGNFGNIAGTPIINQPEVAIMAVGAIVKKPAVIETPQGDLIGIRHKMYLSHTFDHRVIDGVLGGTFVKRVSDYLENFDVNTEI